MPLLLTIRTALYAVFTFWSLMTFILAAAFIGTTNSDGFGYSQAAAELVAAGILGLVTLPVLHFLFHRRATDSGIISSILVELIAVACIWLLFLGGAAALSDQLPFLSSAFCDANWCSLGRAVSAFAWLGWITLTILLGLIIFDLISSSMRNKAAYREPFAAHAAEGTVKGNHPAPAQGQAEMTQQQAPVHV